MSKSYCPRCECSRCLAAREKDVEPWGELRAPMTQPAYDAQHSDRAAARRDHALLSARIGKAIRKLFTRHGISRPVDPEVEAAVDDARRRLPTLQGQARLKLLVAANEVWSKFENDLVARSNTPCEELPWEVAWRPTSTDWMLLAIKLAIAAGEPGFAIAPHPVEADNATGDDNHILNEMMRNFIEVPGVSGNQAARDTIAEYEMLIKIGYHRPKRERTLKPMSLKSQYSARKKAPLPDLAPFLERVLYGKRLASALISTAASMTDPTERE